MESAIALERNTGFLVKLLKFLGTRDVGSSNIINIIIIIAINTLK